MKASIRGWNSPSGHALLTLACLTLAWGACWPIMKFVVGELPIYTFRMLTAWGGGACILLIAGATGCGVWLHRRDVVPAMIGGLLNISGWLYFTALALTLLPAGRAVVLAYTMPLWSAIAAVILLHEPITRRHVVSLAFALFAVLILAGDDLARLGAAPFGVLAILAGAASWGIGTAYQKRTIWRSHLFTVAAWQLLIGGTPLAALAFTFDIAPYARLSVAGALGMAYVVLVATVFGYWAWFRIVRLVPNRIASLGTLPVPLIGVTASILALGEQFGWPVLAALICTTASLATILTMPASPRR